MFHWTLIISDFGIKTGKQVEENGMFEYITKPTLYFASCKVTTAKHLHNTTWSWSLLLFRTTHMQLITFFHTKGCEFEFRSSTSTNGTFTSRNYPGLYPRDTECNYLFYGEEDERIFITFLKFKVEDIPPR